MVLGVDTAPDPTGAVFTIVLVLHLAVVVGSLVVVVAAAVHGWLLGHPDPEGPASRAVQRFFRPGADAAGRVLYLVPVTGALLVVVSRGRFRAGDGFVVIGALLWLAAAVVAEAVLWRTVRQVGSLLCPPGSADPAGSADGLGSAGPAGSGAAPGAGDVLGERVRLGHRIVLGAGMVGLVILGAGVVMVAKP
jgi:hypothetical protein